HMGLAPACVEMWATFSIHRSASVCRGFPVMSLLCESVTRHFGGSSRLLPRAWEGSNPVSDVVKETDMNQEGSHNCWRVRRLFATALLVASLTSATPAVAQDNVVLQWNDALLQTVRTVPFLITARALAILHTSMYDAWAAYDPLAV